MRRLRTSSPRGKADPPADHLLHDQPVALQVDPLTGPRHAAELREHAVRTVQEAETGHRPAAGGHRVRDARGRIAAA